MNVLLDTHIWLWAVCRKTELSSRSRRIVESADNQLWLSPISVWEVFNLFRKGRFQVDRDQETWMKEAVKAIPVTEAVLSFSVAEASARVAADLKDPADRFLVATALVYGLTLVTADREILKLKEIRTIRN